MLSRRGLARHVGCGNTRDRQGRADGNGRELRRAGLEEIPDDGEERQAVERLDRDLLLESLRDVLARPKEKRLRCSL